jgi:hypothetical protein
MLGTTTTIIITSLPFPLNLRRKTTDTKITMAQATWFGS